jgi:hypothetical protein
MANQIAIDVYEFSTGNSLAQKFTKTFIRENITAIEPASIYNFQNTHFPGVNAKITENGAGVLKDSYVAQTVAEITALLDA